MDEKSKLFDRYNTKWMFTLKNGRVVFEFHCNHAIAIFQISSSQIGLQSIIVVLLSKKCYSANIEKSVCVVCMGSVHISELDIYKWMI